MTITESLVEVGDAQLFVKSIKAFPGRPVIVFLHDSLGCVQLWRDFPTKLCQAVQCNGLIFDRLGYGKSAPMESHVRTNSYMETEADVLVELLAALNMSDAVLFGHSDGGSIALIAAGKYPNIFNAVIVEAAHVFVEDITLQGIRNAAEEYATTNLKSRLEKYHGNKTETVFKAWTQTWLSEQFRVWNIEHFLPAIQCPVLFIQGEKDEYGTNSQMYAVKNNVKSCVELSLLPGVAHTPHKESAEVVIAEVSAFVKRIVKDS